MFRSVSQQNVPTANPTNNSMSSTASPSRRPQISHSQTLSSFPDSHNKRNKTRPTGSLLASFLATFTPNTNPSSASSGAPSPNLKQHRSEVELRRDYLSPEREKEIGEIWEMFKRQSQDIHEEDKLTSFPCITEYEYEDQEEDGRR